MVIHIFIYDNLRFGNKENLYLTGSKYLGVGKTAEQYTMVGIKMAKNVYITTDEIESAYPKSFITGELYEIDMNTLAFLDVFILHSDTYSRKIIKIHLKNIEYDAYAYFHDESIFQDRPIRLGGKRFFPVPSGDWSETKFLTYII